MHCLAYERSANSQLGSFGPAEKRRDLRMTILAAESSEFATLSELHCGRRRGRNGCPTFRLLDPGARDVIAHGHEEHDGQPEDGRDDYELRALRAVFGVHEEEHDEGGFA